MTITRFSSTFVVSAIVSLMLYSSTAIAAVGRTAGQGSVSATGEAMYSIPIFAPPGTNGLTPKLALTYGHRQGEGIAGVGWGLTGLSEITRCGRTMAQNGAAGGVNLEVSDRYCLDGNQLRLVSGTYGTAGSTYRTEVDLIARITAYGTAGNGPQWFAVEQKNGRIYEYGQTDDSRIETLATGYGSTARSWLLNEIRDRNLNEIRFHYIEDGAPYGDYRIDYIEYRVNASYGPYTPGYKIEFVYDTQPAEDVDSANASGGNVEDIKLLNRIDVWYTDPNPDTLVRRYQLDYEDQTSSTGRSRIESIEECAGNPASPACLQPTTFTYQDGDADFDSAVSTGTTIPSGTKVLPLDINGDGRTDFAYPSSAGSGNWYYRLANSSGGYEAVQDSGVANTNHSEAIAIDYNADGLEDILVPKSGGTWWVILGSSVGLASPAIDTGTPDTTTAGNAIAMDVNGDGADDLVMATSALIQVRYRDLQGEFSDPPETIYSAGTNQYFITPAFSDVSSRSRERTIDVNGDGYRDVSIVLYEFVPPEAEHYYHEVILGADQGVFSVVQGQTTDVFIDINGDGYTDVAYKPLQTGTLEYAFSTGKNMSAAYVGPSLSGYDFSRAIARDVDSDGFEDLMVPKTSDDKWYYLKSLGTVFASSFTPTGKSASSPQAVFRVDANGDGLDDIGYVKSNGVYAHRPHAAGEPDLLLTATDGNGNSVAFDYAPLTDGGVYTRNTDAAFPEQDYQRPVYVVQSAEYTTGIGTTFTLTYSYEGAQHNLEGRGLNGFDKKTTVDSRNGVKFHEFFKRDFPYRGRHYRTDVRQADDTLIQEVDNTWDVITGGSGNEDYYFPYLKERIEQNYEVGGTYNGNQINKITTKIITIDGYGTPTFVNSKTEEATTGNGLQPGAIFTDRVQHTSITNDVTNWCLGRPDETQFKNSHTESYGTMITRTVSYTWNTTYCRANQRVVEPYSPDYKVTESFGYDENGNVDSKTVTGIGMTARTTTIDWGTTGHLPETVTNALGQATTINWDFSHGRQSSVVDPNGITVSWLYDEFGRLTRETHPDGTYTDFTLTDCVSPSYCSTNHPQVKTQVHASSKATDTTEIRFDDTFLDMADRVVQQEQQRLGGGTSKIRITYDENGRLLQQSMPDFSASPAFYTTVEYDLIGRPTTISRPTDEGNPTLVEQLIDYEGLTTQITDAEGKISNQVADARGRTYRSIDHAGYYQQFEYDPFGSIRQVTDGATPSNVLLDNSYAYGISAFRLSSDDMDMGQWNYEFNALGELTAYYDANTLLGPSPTTPTATFDYDDLGRIKERAEAEGTTYWTWGTSAAAYNIGRLESVSSPGHSESYDFDSNGRLINRTTVADTTYDFDYAYDPLTGFLQSITYPVNISSGRPKIDYEYQYGILNKVIKSTSVYWQANADDAWGNIIDVSRIGGIQTIRGFDAVTGLPTYIQSGRDTGTDRQNMEYQWDNVGNLTQRKDVDRSLTEDFVYDSLHRLDYSLLNQSTNLDLTYDSMGNIIAKSDIGGGSTWTYDPDRKHAVTQAGPNSYSYDENGNQITRNGNAVDWTSYNYPSHIENGSEYHDFYYDANRQRFKREYFDGTDTETTIYVGGLLEKKITSEGTEYRNYIYAGDEPVNIYSRRTFGSTKNRVLFLNHQGSIAVGTVGSNGNVSWEEDFTAFGERRDPNDWSGPPSSAELDTINSNSERGYTFHSNLEGGALIHMNGRVADASIGRFLSADPFIPDPGNTQAFNRYSYAYNNPLSYTDPSGFSPDGCIIECFIIPSIIKSIFGLFGGGSSAPPPPPPGCYGWAVSCYGAAPTNTGVFISDVYDLPLYSALGNLIDLYTCTRIMNNPLSCLFGSPIGGGIGTPGFGGGGIGNCFVAGCGGEWDGITLNFADTVVDAGFVVYDFGNVLGAIIAYVVGVATEDEELKNASAEGLEEARGDLIGSTIGLAVPFLPAWTTRAARGAGIVASNGTRVTGFTRHGVNRAIGDAAERAGTRPQAILDALKNPTKEIVEGIDSKGRPFQIFHGADARVIVNPQTGQIVSTNPLSAAGAL